MLLIGNQLRAIGEAEPIAGQMMDFRYKGYSTWLTSLVKEHVTGANLAHTRPAGRRRKWRLKRQPFAHLP